MRSFPLLLLAGVSVLAQTSATKPSPGQLQTGAWKSLKYNKLGEVKIPQVDVVTLKNGIKVYLLENHTLPFISGSALVRSGSLLNPAEKTGMAEVMGAVMRSGGTKSKTGDQIDEQMENIAASVEAGMADDSATVSFSCLKENIDEVLGVFQDVLANPEFRQDKIDLIKTQYRSAIGRRYDDADEVNRNEFNAIVYGRETPFGRDVEYETIDAITRPDLIAFHKRYFYPANLVMSVQGDFDKSAMIARLEQVVGGWTPAPGQAGVFPQVTNAAKPGVYFGEKKDVTQSFLSIGHLGGLYSDKDYPALEVLSDILGGSFDSRLFRKVRTELGYAYGIGGGWGADYAHPGTFRMGASTKSETTAETIRVMLAEVERIRNEPVADEELATAKEKVVNSFVFNFDRPQKTLGRLVRYDYYGYPKDYLAQYQKSIAAVTKADIQRVAKRYIDPAKFVIVVIGNSENFKTPLADLKLPVTKLDLTIKEPKKEAAKADGASLAKGKLLLGKMQAAMGGADKLAAVKDLRMTANASLGNMAVKQSMTVILPNQLRSEQTLPFGRLVVMFDGAKGMLIAPNQPAAMPMPAPVLKQITGEIFRSPIGLVLSDRDPARTVNALSDTEVEISDKSGNSAKLTMDASTGLPAKLSYENAGPQGNATVENVMKDWGETGGVKMPFLIEIMQAGVKASEVKFETITVNGGVKPEEIMKQ